ncbi:efflux RND transporter periplasmic adaptor subunit [Methylovulum psychrotolerans]|uniref:Efflux RND transporter periplasmic adaptor subunit n=1 Tax=Methylovulum psychrotolerans TaxID=1704499 RepID=A0A2S5CKV3_9GAMM|nr:efflux RND transporter periplasmic adaptor subunit [Methylovulum psychrotolerans]POZ51372.1 efflux RND transporter periplasmic adaptor subunit [Methylovulum psychrotolerans]
MERSWFSRHIAIILLVLAAVLAGGYWFGPWRTAEKKPDYRTEILVKGKLTTSISANGTLNPVVLVNVGTQISGVVNKLNVDFNDRVTKGQILAEIDPSLINAQLEQSQANLANTQASLKLAQLNAQRSYGLYAQDYIAKSELDQSVQALAVAKALVDAAEGLLKRDKTNRGYTIIKSPVSGVVVSRSVDIGQTVAASFTTPTLFTIAKDLKTMQIDTSVAEADVGGVRKAQAVNFSVDAYPDRVFTGAVRRIRLDSTVLQNVVTYDVVIDVSNPDEILLPGMTAFVNIVIEERGDSLKLPLAALKFRPVGSVANKSAKTVYRLEKGAAVAIPVELGINDGKYAEVIGGALQAGDALILENSNAKPSAEKTAADKQNFRIKAF